MKNKSIDYVQLIKKSLRKLNILQLSISSKQKIIEAITKLGFDIYQKNNGVNIKTYEYIVLEPESKKNLLIHFGGEGEQKGNSTEVTQRRV